MARTKGPNAIDVHVGSRMRMRCMMLGMKEKLGDAFGLTFQQVQKYENGKNRMGASRLQQAADILEVAVPFFSREQPAALTAGRQRCVAGLYQRVRHEPRWPSIGEGIHARAACDATLYCRSCEQIAGEAGNKPRGRPI